MCSTPYVSTLAPGSEVRVVMSSQTPPTLTEDADEAVVEHSDMLHNRIQFLTEELKDAEQTILELQDDSPSADDDVVTVNMSDDAFESRLLRYGLFLSQRFDENQDEVEMLFEDIAERFDEYVESSNDVHNASLAMLAALLKHEEMTR